MVVQHTDIEINSDVIPFFKQLTVQDLVDTIQEISKKRTDEDYVLIYEITLTPERIRFAVAKSHSPRNHIHFNYTLPEFMDIRDGRCEP